MKNTFFLTLFLAANILFSQADTEVYLFDLKISEDEVELTNPKNISDNEGYDNQPSFLDANTILFASTRDEQTDVIRFDITQGSQKTWLTDTPTGSEYSPIKIPGKNTFSAIRLDLDGLQRLYAYDLKTGKSSVLLKDLKVGYHVWYNEDIIVSTVLIDNRMDLVVSNLKDGSNYTLQKNVGRSLHKIPGTDLVSYISKENDAREIKSLHPISGATQKITNLPKGAEDMCWLSDGSILCGMGKSILRFHPEKKPEWQSIMTFKSKEINNISRIAANRESSRLVFVAEKSPEHIVQKQLDAYNARDIEAFLNTYTDDIKLYDFPNGLRSEGKERMRKGYASFFESTPDLHCEIKNRIVIGNKVIDEEYITANGNNFSAVAIYEVENGKIVKVTFLR